MPGRPPFGQNLDIVSVGESSREEVISVASGCDETIVEQMLAGSIWPRCVVCGLCEQTRLDEL